MDRYWSIQISTLAPGLWDRRTTYLKGTMRCHRCHSSAWRHCHLVLDGCLSHSYNPVTEITPLVSALHRINCSCPFIVFCPNVYPNSSLLHEFLTFLFPVKPIVSISRCHHVLYSELLYFWKLLTSLCYSYLEWMSPNSFSSSSWFF